MTELSGDTPSTSIASIFNGKWSIYIVAVLVVLLVKWVRAAFGTGLWHIPGPVLAKISRFYIVKHVVGGDLHQIFTDLHREYGPVVRYAPNKVSVADPAAITLIYGVNNRFMKASLCMWNVVFFTSTD